MEIAAYDAAQEKHDRKKRKKNREIEVASQEGFVELSTKDEKRKKKREKSEEEIGISSNESKQLTAEEEAKKQIMVKEAAAPAENVSGKEGSSDDAETSKPKKSTHLSQEGSDEPESKAEKKKRRKRENRLKHDMPEDGNSLEIGLEAEAATKKHDKKKEIVVNKDIESVSQESFVELESEPERKAEKKKRKREKNHKHYKLEDGNSLEIGLEAEAATKKHDKKREIEVNKDIESVSQESFVELESEPERKAEKKKRKREKSHKHYKLEDGNSLEIGLEAETATGKHDKKRETEVVSQEGFVEPESKAEKTKKRKSEKTDKHDKPQKKTQEIEDNSIQEAEAASGKHDKKKRKKNREIEVDKDSEVASQEGFVEESTKDETSKKKSKWETSEEEIDISTKESKQLVVEEKAKNKKQKKVKEAVPGGPESLRENVSRKERSFDDTDTSKTKKPTEKKPRKNVSFSGDVQVFPLGNEASPEADDNTEKPLVQGKRFTKEEDELLKNAVQKYIEGNQLGSEGLRMVLNCSKYPRARKCWKDIGLSIPWRPLEAVYYRAHVLFERSEARKWEPHEYDTLMRLYKVHGTNWRAIGEELGKHRFQVKDTWRRIENQNRRHGQWSQEEYQALFDLVNLDLTMKAFDEKKTKHGMLRDNISWGAISKKLSTRNFADCCMKWYYQLSSPLVKEGHWFDIDDYLLLDALEKLDACCVEDVDWDNLLEHRSGEYCQRRWAQMVRYIGGYREKPFIEQVEVLCNRYCPEMLKYRNGEVGGTSGSAPHRETENEELVQAD